MVRIKSGLPVIKQINSWGYNAQHGEQLIKLYCIFKGWKKSQSYKFLSQEKNVTVYGARC